EQAARRDGAQRQVQLAQLASEQAALRRVATLVACGASPSQTWSTVAAQVGQLLGADVTMVLRVEPDGTGTVVGGWSVPGVTVPTGGGLTVEGTGVAVSVLRTGQPAHTERFEGPSGSLPDRMRQLGVQSGVGAPVSVEGRLWGVVIAASRRAQQLPAGSESRIAEFTELLGTAIANAQARVELHRIADEQAALRRVATLVARSASPAEVLSAVASEVQDLLNADGAMVFRFEHDATATLFATAGADTPPGTRWTMEPPLAIEAVYRTGRPARVDDYGRASGQVVEEIIGPEKVRSSVASPIVVGGRLWGAIVIASRGVPLPTDTEQRMVDFTELVATAIANTQAREELRVIAEEQAALRRVATLVARGEPPAAVFAAVAGEVGQVLTAADFTMVGRYDPDHTVEVVGGWSRAGNHRLVGRRARLGGRNVSTLVFHRNQPARVDHFADVSAVVVDAGELGMRSSVGAPISVEGRLWGVMIVASTHEDALPDGAEHRLAQFTDLVATAIANAQAREELRVIAEEQAALRRVATLVAQGEPPAAVFAAVAKEVGQILPAADYTAVGRYEPDRAFEVVGSWSRISSHPLPVGHRASLHGQTLAALVFDTGRPARSNSDADVLSGCAAEARTRGVGSAVAAPISVEGRVWGVIMVASTRQEPLAPETEERLADFTELVATAIANAQAREELRRVANEQAALRRVATLVARAAPPAMVFTAVTEEVLRLCPAEVTLMGCYEPDDTVTIIAGWSATGAPVSVGTRVALGGHNVTTLVFHTSRPARIDNYTEASGAAATAARAEGTHSVVGAPILVAGRLWGVVIAASTRDQGLAADTETRLAGFTELVATAIANTDAHAQLTASRARIVATADHTRRRIERDLHDGAQQRLVSLALQLRMAQATVPPQLDELAAELDHVVAGLTSTLDELREIARGIHPAILADGGLAAALKVLARRSSVPVRLEVRIPARLPERVEVTGYYVVSEALTNSAKHAHASTAHVAADVVNGHLRLSVTDDGVGGADPTRGTGLVGLTDRVEAIGGTLIMHSRPGQGTSLIVELPVDSG
ncbi:MAG TPA: GAF domain-containing sensor histidine kinase, partial [Pseudonocardiaceae bacterium]|nr:GAF domain-containing sensor histidine kinase [Pseudonocardiaceae bacterium]